ncbi:hypothetical protein BRC97_01605 [Halobacteriales archaeon QS_6_71_20]|nr:MAG: hypothetical protein BRC97_01605 [Halobacteriales archaeon QS_6_71_20]
MVSDHAAPERCPDCGRSLDAGDRFCSGCGSPVAAPGRAGEASPEDRAWLRRRIADLREKGWDVVVDRGDRVVLRRRGVGGLWTHAALLLATGGVGNLVYALYRYTSGAPRREVHADGAERRLSGGGIGVDVPTAVAAVVAGVLAVVAAVWVGVAVLAELSAAALVGGALAFVLLALAAALVPRVARDGRKPLSTFGRERSVEREHVRTPPDPCAACGRRVVRGEHRRYAERLYVAGLPVATSSSGANTYCASCAAADAGAGVDGRGEAEPGRIRAARRGETSGRTEGERREHERDRGHDPEREAERR